MSPISRADSTRRALQGLVRVVSDLRTEDHSADAAAVRRHRIKINLEAAERDLSAVLESCIAARGMYATNPRIRNHLVALSPKFGVLAGLVGEVLSQIKTQEATSQARQGWAATLEQVVLELNTVDFIPPEEE